MNNCTLISHFKKIKMKKSGVCFAPGSHWGTSVPKLPGPALTTQTPFMVKSGVRLWSPNFTLLILNSFFVLVLDKLPLIDSRSASSLESYDSDQFSKSPNAASRLKPPTSVAGITTSPAYTNGTSSAFTLNSHAIDDAPVALPSDIPNCSSMKDSTSEGASLTTDTARPQPLSMSVLPNKQECPSKISVRSNSQSSAAPLLDGYISQSFEDSDAERNRFAENSVTSLEDAVRTSVRDSLRLSDGRTSCAPVNQRGSFNSRLLVNVDSALQTKRVAPTISSPSEDFQSIYASNADSMVSGHKTAVSESEPQTGYFDLDGIDAWLEFPTPGKSPGISLSVSRRTVWYVDRAERLYYSTLGGPGLSWKIVDQPTEQVSSSPSGFIVWRVWKGSAFTAVGRITGKYPAGTEWREVVREVSYVAADDNVVWYGIYVFFLRQIFIPVLNRLLFSFFFVF